MNKIVIIVFTFLVYSCVVPVSIGNKSIAEVEGKETYDANTVYTNNVKTMVAINYILPQRAGQFEMLTKTIIMPAIKREDTRSRDFGIARDPEASKMLENARSEAS